MNPIDRCRVELASIDELIRAGHEDARGLRQAAGDWIAEEVLLTAMPKKNPAAVALGRKGGLVKGRKGFAAIPEADARKIRAKALRTRRRNAAKARRGLKLPSARALLG